MEGKYLINITTEMKTYNTLHNTFKRLSSDALNDFNKNFTVYFKNIDDVHSQCESIVLEKYAIPAIELAIESLISLKVHDVDADYFINEYLEPIYSWNHYFHLVDDKYNEIVLTSEALDEYRTARREGRGKWIGGGFGFNGAIKGATQAAALNLATGVAHGIWNVGAKTISSIGDGIKKDSLYKDPETKETLAKGVSACIYDTFNALIDIINDKSPNSIPATVIDNASKASRILKNINKIPENDLKKTLTDVVQLNPYAVDAYTALINKFGDTDHRIEETALLFGIVDAIKNEKKKLFMDKFRSYENLDFHKFERSKQDLEKYAALLGFDEGKQLIEEKSIAVYNEDIKIRTVNEKLYDTEKEAQEVRTELNKRTFNHVVYDTEQQAIEAKNKYNNEINEQKARTVNGVIYKNKEEADKIRNKKNVRIPLAIGIFLMPYIFSWITLRKGYSVLSRTLSFGWMIALVLPYLLTANDMEVTNESPAANITEQKSSIAQQPSETRYFNFMGGRGTVMSIEVTPSNQAIVTFHGSSDSEVLYKGPFSNEIKFKDGSGIKFDNNNQVFLMSNIDSGTYEKGCIIDGEICSSELWE